MPTIEELDPDEVDAVDFPLPNAYQAAGNPFAGAGRGGPPGAGGMPPNMEAFAQMMSQMGGTGGMGGLGGLGGLGGMPGMGGMGSMAGMPPAPKKDDSRYKHWNTIYPIYLDIKAPHCHGGRRVSKDKALRWPLAWMMAQACKKLGFPCELEEEKTHPADWANPGRVKVCMKKNDKPLHRTIKTKYQLLCAIGQELQPVEERRLGPRNRRGPLPPIQMRLPPLSPAISHGVLDNAGSGGGIEGMMQAMGMGPPPEAVEAKKEVEKKTVVNSAGGKKKKGKK